MDWISEPDSSMTRRQMLTIGVTGLGISTVGCLDNRNSGTDGNSEATDTNTDGNSEATDVKYERCALQLVPLEDLPNPAKEEASTAIRDDVYETNSELTLPEAIDIANSYIIKYGTRKGDEYVYYNMTVSTDNGVTHLYAEEIRPETSLPSIQNGMEADATVDIRIKSEGKLVLDETIDLAAGAYTELNIYDTATQPRYGNYQATVIVSTKNDSREEVLSWQTDHIQNPSNIYISADGVRVRLATVERPVCEWSDQGELVKGPGQ